MTDWWAITRENQLGEYRRKTTQFINDLESILNEFEKTADTKELSSQIKDAIKKFQEESKG